MKFRLAFAVLALVAILGCSAFDKSSDDSGGKGAPRAKVAAAPMGELKEGGLAFESIPDRKIIRSIHLSLEVKDLRKAADGIEKIAAELNGFVADSRSYEDDAGRKTMHLRLRVPASGLSDAANRIKEFGHVREENISGDDVTEEYVDLEARLDNAKRLEARILTLLDRESKNLKDVLDVEQELAKVREKIETIEGRKQFMDDRVALATITVDLSEPPGLGRGIFEPLYGLLHRALSMFTASVAVLVVVTSAAVPWIALFVIAAWLLLQFLRFWIRRRREMRAQRMQNGKG